MGARFGFRMSGGTPSEGADWSTSESVQLWRPQCHRTIATPKQPKLANKFRHDRTTQGAWPIVRTAIEANHRKAPIPKPYVKNLFFGVGSVAASSARVS